MSEAPPLHTIRNDPELKEMVDAANKAAAATLLDDVRSFLGRFCLFPDEHAHHAVTLWAAHAHMIQHFYTTPRLMLSSPEAQSGKTRVLELLDLLVPEPMMSLSASPATIFRTLEKQQITLLFDEVDTIFKGKGKDDNNEDLRALLNAGYKRGATIPRCVGPKHEVVRFPVFSAVALAGIGDLPDTIMSRSIIIRMRRKAKTEKVEPFRARIHESSGYVLRDRLAEWAAKVGMIAGNAFPILPDGVTDRPAEIWEPLISIADLAGEHWSERSRAACISMCRRTIEGKTTLGVRLLEDLRTVFAIAKDPPALHTEVIIEKLCAGAGAGLDDDAPWSDLYGKQITVRQLATMLKQYGITSTKVTVAGKSLQGYRRDALWDAWQRYIPAPPAKPEFEELVESGGGTVPEVPEVPDLRPSTVVLNGRKVSNAEVL